MAAKYRRLRTDELEQLEKYFIQYLSAYSISADYWEDIKNNKPNEALTIIDLFSDLVYESSITRVKYLKIATPKDVREMHCDDNVLKILGLEANESANIDLTNPEHLERIFEGDTEGVSIYSVEEPYKKSRDYDIFGFFEVGFRASDGKFFELLKKIKED